jgi:hypothetical protein
MKSTIDGIANVIALLIMVVPWLMGIVLAKGFWSTLFAIFPPYAWYLVVERFMQLNGWT